MDQMSLWIIAGIVLLISEMLTGGFFMLFVALGCFAAAFAASLSAPTATAILTCAFVSVIGVLTLRKPIQRRLLKTIKISADIGNEIRIDQTIAPHKQQRITYQGVSWLATNLDAEEIKEGDHVVIVGIDGNTLLIRKVN